ncbi:MAG TPA: 6-carboxytetrahydropterin synthase QueD [Candidatus Acidoferrales bacterium]|nr:6-carboxytetrahydropterin synthase QueD [Candidatus Acidoferrales bacterium]
MFEVSVEAAFAAAHRLRGYQGKCEELHGHNYRVRLIVAGDQLDQIGLLQDFTVLKRVLRGIVDKLDHKYLNELPPFDKMNPSAENLARFIHDEMVKQLAGQLGEASLASVTVWETDTAAATYKP